MEILNTSTNALGVFDYSITLDVEAPSAVSDSFIILSGRVRHAADHAVQLNFPPQTPLRLGYRILSTDNQMVVFEDRVRFDAQDLITDIEYAFDVSIPRNCISTQPALISLDFLYERSFWFSQTLMKPPPTFSISAIRDVVPNIAMPDSPITSDTLATQLFNAFRQYDFSGYGEIKNCFGSQALSPDMAFDEDLLRSTNFIRDSSDVVPVTDLMIHYAHARRQSGVRGLTTRSGRFELLREMFCFLERIDCEGGNFIPDSTIEYLNDSVLSDGLFDVPMTRLMLWFWLSEGKPLRPQMRNDREGVFWWWVTGAMPTNHVPAAFIGDEVTAYLACPHENFRGRQIPLTRFFYRAFKESKAVQDRYNIGSDSGLVAYSFDTLIHSLSDPRNFKFIGSATIDFWTQPVTDDERDPTAFELALAISSGNTPPIEELNPKNDLRKAVRHAIVEGAKNIPPAWRRLLSTRTQEALARKCYNIGPSTRNSTLATVDVVGLVSSQSGLGVNARMSKATFEALGLAVNMVDSRTNSHAGPEASAVALYHVNADALPSAVLEGGGRRLRTRTRLGFFLWELDVVPESHKLGLELVHQILVPTEFLRGVYSNATKTPVHNVGKFLLTPDIGRLRAKRSGRFVFLVSFDFHSGVERKNPLAALRAFCAAFPPEKQDVQIIVKTTEYVPNHWGDPNDQWLSIAEIAKRDPRVRVVTDMLSEARFFDLINQCDCIVSAHRAEGFGYLPAYGLLLNKAVIVTDYSGTKDFCNSETAWPISFRMKPVGQGEFIAEVPGAAWADIDFAHLVETMRHVVYASEEVSQKAAVGIKLVKSRYSIEAHSARYKSVLTDLGYGVSGEPKRLVGAQA